MKTRLFVFASLALATLVSCQEVIKPATVSQVSVGSQIVKISADGDTKTVQLTANCEWTTSSSASWVSIEPAAGTGDAQISIIVAANASDAREATVTVNAVGASTRADILVSQNGVAVVNPNPGGDDNPPLGENTISNVNQLISFINEAPSMTAEDEWTVEADIDCGGASIGPIPAFSGILDGKNHKIYNYKVVSSDANAGLFLTLDGTVKNLILGSSDGKAWDGVSSVSFVEGATTAHAGGVVADLAGTLDNVKNFATVSVAENNTIENGVGGLVGYIAAPASILNCENGAFIEYTLGATMGQGSWVGGICGHANNAQALIYNCVNSADLEFTLVTAKFVMYGGILGCSHLGAVVDKCTNNGSVSYRQSGSESAGNYMMIAGIAGGVYSNSVVTNCINNGEVFSNRMQVSRSGGIVGTLNTQGLIEGNVNNGKVIISQDYPNGNWQAAAGIVGFQEKGNNGNIIRKNTNNGEVVIICENATTHANKVAAGGILGQGVLGLEIEENVNNAAVSVANKGTGGAWVGGIIGRFYGAGSYTKGNTNTGTVKCEVADASAAVAGGVVGYSSATTNVCTGDKNTGDVVCANTGSVGSIAGTNDGTLENCIAGGTVNGTAVNSGNIATLTQGTSSSGTAKGTTAAN